MDVIAWDFLFIGVNGAILFFVQRSSDIWVIVCNYVESVTFVRKRSNISLWGRCAILYMLFIIKHNGDVSPEDEVYWRL
jgi:hypothetical protein